MVKNTEGCLSTRSGAFQHGGFGSQAPFDFQPLLTGMVGCGDGATWERSWWKNTSVLTGHPQMGGFSPGLGFWATPGKKSINAKFLPTKSIAGACSCCSYPGAPTPVPYPVLQLPTPVPPQTQAAQATAGSLFLWLLVGQS